MQRTAVSLIGSGVRDFRNASWGILRDCHALQTLIGLNATGQTNASIVQELVNLGVGITSLQLTLQGVVTNLASSLAAQSTPANVPSDCATTANMLDELRVPPTDARFAAWFDRCSQYLTEWAIKDAAAWDQDWAQAANVRCYCGLRDRNTTVSTASARPAEKPQRHELVAQLQLAWLE